MRVLAWPALLLLAAAQARAHLMQLCTSSDPAQPGSVTFFLGTYHYCTNSAPGQMHIKTPSGIESTGLFDDNRCTSGTKPSGSSNGQALTASIISTYSLPSTAIVNCFTRLQQAKTGSVGSVDLYGSKILQPGTSANSVSDACFPSSTVNTWYRVSVTDAITGEYEVWTTGTDINLDPGWGSFGGATGSPCTMNVNRHFTADLSIAAVGLACSGFTGSILNADVPAACNPSPPATVASGFLCPVVCGLNSAGQLDCDNGQWRNTYSCVSSVCSNTASTTFTGMTSVSGNGCGYSTAVGTTCYPVCGQTDYWAAETAAVTCESSGTWSGAGECQPPGDDVASHQPQNLVVQCVDSTRSDFTLKWDAPPGGHGGSAVQRYEIAVTSGTVTGLATGWNSPTPPSAGLTGTATTTNVGVLVRACNVNLCNPSASVAVTCFSTDPPVVVSGPGSSNTQPTNTNVPTTAIYVPPPPGCMPYQPCWINPPASVSGDPFTTDKDGNKVQFFLPHHVDTPLLKCGYFELYGRAKHSGLSGDHQQWFDRFSFRADGKEMCVVGINQTRDGEQQELEASRKELSTITVTLQGEPVPMLTEVWDEYTYGGMSVSISRNESRPIGKGFAETADITIGAFRMQVWSATASKFASSTLQRLHTHLDIRFVTLDKKQCTAGVLAEIWGAAAMSNATSKMLKPTE